MAGEDFFSSQVLHLTPEAPAPKPFNLRQILEDPDFRALSQPARRDLLQSLDPDNFNDQKLSLEEMNKVVGFQRPADLPSDLPKRVGEASLSALPSVGAGLAVMAGPETWPAAVGLSMLGGAGGSAVEQSLRYATDMNAPQSWQEAERRVGAAGLEQGTYELGGRALKGVLSRTFGPYLNAERLYQSGLKPSGVSQRQAERSVEAGLREKVRLTPWASEKIRSRIGALNDSIERTIANAPADISPARYVKNIQGKLDVLRSKWGADATYGRDFLKQIDDFERNFLIEHGNVQPRITQVYNPQLGNTPATQLQKKVIMPEDMSLADLRANARPVKAGRAQEIKKATYEALRTSSGETPWTPGAHPELSTRTREEIVKGIKEELEYLYPDIKGLNRREGALINLDKQVDRWAKREMNKHLTPYFGFSIGGALLGGHFGGGAGAGIGSTIGLVSAQIMRSALEDPEIKSGLAIALNRARQLPGAGIVRRVAAAPETIPTAIRAGAYAVGPGQAALSRSEGQYMERLIRRYARKTETPATPPQQTPQAPAPVTGQPRAGLRHRNQGTQAQALTAAGERHGVPPVLMHAIAQTESSGNPQAVSGKGATGLMQLMPATARQYGVRDIRNVAENIEGSARYLRHLWTKYRGNVALVAAAYNAGEGAVDRHGGVPPYRETRNYVARVMNRMAEQRRAG